MTTGTPSLTHPSAPVAKGGLRPLLILAGLLIGQLLAISLLYNHNFEFTCRAAAPAVFCQFLSQSVIRVICMAGVVTLFAIARPVILRALRAAQRAQLHKGWLGLQIAGFVMCLAPWLFLSDASSGAGVATGAALWLAGGALAALGAVFALYPAAAWDQARKTAGWGLPVVLLLAGLAPEIAAYAQSLWAWDPLAEITFYAVEAVLEQVLGYQVASDAPSKLILLYQFGALVGPQCSGIEGFLLILSFLSFYIWLFRRDLRFPRVWLLLPIGLLLSWIFNIIRIAALIVIGEEMSPDLAANGFHSHAGWLMFTILSISLAITAHLSPWFRKDKAGAAVETASAKSELPPFFEDINVVQILPFIVFMATGLLVSTFAELPGLYYPLRLIAMAGVLALVLPALRRINWSIDPLALGAGAVLGVIWIATSPTAGEEDSALMTALGTMSAAGFAFWAAARVAGTVIFVPIIEELFFRGYVLRRLDWGGMPMRLAAIAISSGLFAYLHDRWALAFVAGVLFALLMLRRNRIADAVWAHVAANGLIAGWAVVTGDWAAI
jgi:exosortase E/protease (VPEID-CTERM system)